MKRSKCLSSCLLVFMLVFLYFSQVSAQETYVVTIGQEKVFTECNYHPTPWVTDDSNHLPLPAEVWGRSEGNTATAYARAINSTEGQSGISYSVVGVQFSWDLGEYTWEEVLNAPINVTLNVTYTISANWELPNGAANAGVLTYNPLVWQRWIGHGLNTKGTLNDTATIQYSMTVEGLQELNNIIAVESRAHAHLNQYGGPESIAYSQVTINSIKISPGCDFSTSPPIERCFGGIGSQCEGFFLKNPITCRATGLMSVGSILHDKCCVRYNNIGVGCSNPRDKNFCKTEWDLAKDDVYCWRMWLSEFGPYFVGNIGDDIQKEFKAKRGDLVHPDYQSFCPSFSCRVDATTGKIITEGKGKCRYCECE